MSGLSLAGGGTLAGGRRKHTKNLCPGVFVCFRTFSVVSGVVRSVRFLFRVCFCGLGQILTKFPTKNRSETGRHETPRAETLSGQRS